MTIPPTISSRASNVLRKSGMIKIDHINARLVADRGKLQRWCRIAPGKVFAYGGKIEDEIRAVVGLPPRETQRREVMADLYQVMRRGFDLIIEDQNMKLAADAYRFAAGTIDETEVEIAAKYGVGKAAVSKRVNR